MRAFFHCFLIRGKDQVGATRATTSLLSHRRLVRGTHGVTHGTFTFPEQWFLMYPCHQPFRNCVSAKPHQSWPGGSSALPPTLFSRRPIVGRARGPHHKLNDHNPLENNFRQKAHIRPPRRGASERLRGGAALVSIGTPPRYEADRSSPGVQPNAADGTPPRESKLSEAGFESTPSTSFESTFLARDTSLP